MSLTYTLDLDTQITEVNGQPSEGDRNHLGRFIAQRMFAGLSGETAKNLNTAAIKIHDWSIILYNRNPLQLDREDLDRFTELLNHLQIPCGVIGQTLMIIKASKDAAESSKSKKKKAEAPESGTDANQSENA